MIDLMLLTVLKSMNDLLLLTVMKSEIVDLSTEAVCWLSLGCALAIWRQRTVQ